MKLNSGGVLIFLHALKNQLNKYFIPDVIKYACLGLSYCLARVLLVLLRHR